MRIWIWPSPFRPRREPPRYRQRCRWLTETLVEEPVMLMVLVPVLKPLEAEPRRAGNDGFLSNKSRGHPPKRWCFAKTRDISGSASI
jgi:hypothetical protein